MADSPPFDPTDYDDPRLQRLGKGLNLLFAAEVAQEVLEAVDVQQLQAGVPLEDAVDGQQLAAAMGQPAGRLLAQGAARGALGGGLAGLLAREIAGRAGAKACRMALEQVDTEQILAAVEHPGRRNPLGGPRTDVYHVPVEAGGTDADDTSVPDEESDDWTERDDRMGGSDEEGADVVGDTPADDPTLADDITGRDRTDADDGAADDNTIPDDADEDWSEADDRMDSSDQTDADVVPDELEDGADDPRDGSDEPRNGADDSYDGSDESHDGADDPADSEDRDDR